MSCSIVMSSKNFLRFFFTYIKMSKDSSPKYHQNNTERLQEKKLVKCGHEKYKNLPEDEKQKNVECKKKYYKMRKKSLITIIRNII